ncbi:MAG: DUF115 domain-containing protein [Planctomycetes bacterium]|nr:DUF115 domain-containing protein [Planctomycetota bacterium]
MDAIPPSGGTGLPVPNPITLQRNLAALARTSPDTATLIQSASPHPSLDFFPTDDGVPAAILTITPTSGPSSGTSQAMQLCSRRHPLAEAEALAKSANIETNAAIVVNGFGLGYHVAAMARQMKRSGIILVLETDLPLLRSVLERLDFSEVFEHSNVALFTDPTDIPAISARVAGFEGILCVGAKIVDHPPSRVRLNAAAHTFGASFAHVIRAARTSVVTTLVQVDVTLRNLFQNVDRYATEPGIAHLANAMKGKPAIVVSAGPSLARNIDLLSRPGVRDRFVIIAVQTVLKQLLAKSIKPHFVTALDYHEISRRFYEGLTAADVEGITLIVESKANPAILQSWPGELCMPAEPWLDTLLGDDLKRDMHPIAPGATVAHLAYYAARHLGCDPVILIGQDLGFTDGQYYASGAAIHDVWASELNQFRTLEMFELERILRFGKMLSRREDSLGRPILTDEQMSAYLLQFERDFKADTDRGLRIIDATEGGVKKQFTSIRTLADCLTLFGTEPLGPLPTARSASDPSSRLSRLHARITRVRLDTLRVAALSRQARDLLDQARQSLDDTSRINKIITRLHDLRSTVERLTPAYDLVQYLNQTGGLNRFKHDRAISMSTAQDERTRLLMQLERDRTNVAWLADAAEHLARLLDDSLSMLSGAPRVTREAAPTPDMLAAAGLAPSAAARKVIACVLVDEHRSGLGTARDLSAPLHLGCNPLELTLNRLRQSAHLDQIVLLSADPARALQLAGAHGPHISAARIDPAHADDHFRALRATRACSRASWRGGISNSTVFDEALIPSALSAALSDHSADACILLGADWSLIDPSLIDLTIQRHLERPDTHKLIFSQAPCGISPCLLSRDLVDELAANRPGAGAFASIGALLGYIPIAPQLDPLGKNCCLHIAPFVRDLPSRLIADTPDSRALITSILTTLGPTFPTADAEAIARAAHSSGFLATRPDAPTELFLELVGSDHSILDTRLAERILRDLGGANPAAAVTFLAASPADPCNHPNLIHLIHAAKDAGIGALHLRTRLNLSEQERAALLAAPIDIISIDLLAPTAESFARITGLDPALWHDSTAALSAALAQRAPSSIGLPTPFLIPRLQRRDETYPLDERYAELTMISGGCVIDPPTSFAGRITPLAIPLRARLLQSMHHIAISSAGRVSLKDSLANWVEGGALSSSTSLLHIWSKPPRVAALPALPPLPLPASLIESTPIATITPLKAAS